MKYGSSIFQLFHFSILIYIIKAVAHVCIAAALFPASLLLADSNERLKGIGYRIWSPQRRCRHEKSCAILLMQSGLVPKVERGGSPDAFWWYLSASGLPLRTRFCTSPDAFKIIPDAFRYQLNWAKM